MSIKYFATIEDHRFDKKFAQYLESFKQYLMDEFKIKNDFIIQMIYSKEAKGIDIIDFLEDQFEDNNRNLMYLLLREFDVISGLTPGSNASSVISSLFNYEHTLYKSSDQADEFLRNHGCAGLVNTFPVDCLMTRFELASLLYSDIRHEEYFNDDGLSGTADITDYLKSSARRICVHESSQSESSSFTDINPHSTIASMSSPDFLKMSVSQQSEIIDQFINDVYNDDDLHKDSSPEVYLKNISSVWPVESMRARIISGQSIETVIQNGEQLVRLLLDKSDINKNEIEETCRHIMMSALAPFPEIFKEVFEGSLPPSYIFRQTHLNARDFVGDIVFEIGLGFNFNAGSIGLASGSIRALNEYGDFGKKIMLEMIGENGLSSSSIEDLSYKTSSVDGELFGEIVAHWLNSLQKIETGEGITQEIAVRKISMALLTISDTGKELFSNKNEAIIESYNNALLFALTTEGVRNNYHLDFKFSNNEEKKKFVEKSIIEKNMINKSVIEAGKFSQSDFSRVWNKVSAEHKKIIFSNDLGL